MIFLCTKYHVPSSNSLLFITIKQKAEYRFRATAMLMICTLEITLIKFIFLEDLHSALGPYIL
jgi:hypothetical protein